MSEAARALLLGLPPAPPALAAAALGLAVLLALSCSAMPVLRRLLAVAACRRAIFKFWYGRIAADHRDQDSIVFMNYGFSPTRAGEELAPAERADQLCANLYRRVAGAAGSLKGKRVLEVGAGRGGGASLVARALAPAKLVACDYSPSAVALAQRRHAAVRNLEFVEGDAEALPFADASFDAVLNVESSHCYGSIERFVAEVARVLKPGGAFCMCDFRTVADMRALEALLRAQPALELVEAVDITANVVAALEEDDDRKRLQIAALTGPFLRGLMGEFAGLRGGIVYEGFKARTSVYWRFACRKKAA